MVTARYPRASWRSRRSPSADSNQSRHGPAGDSIATLRKPLILRLKLHRPVRSIFVSSILATQSSFSVTLPVTF